MLTRFRVELVNKLTRQQLPILSSAPSLTRRNLASKREEEEGREKDFVARQERERLQRQLAELNKKVDPHGKQADAELDAIGGLTQEQKDKLKQWKNKV